MLLNHRAVALAFMVTACAPAFADFDGPAPVAWRWAESTSVAPSGEPQFSGNAVYVAVGGRIYGIDRTSGNTLWRYPAGEPIAGAFRQGCALGDGLVVAAGDDKSVYAVRTDGTLAWQYLGQDPIATNVVVAGNTVVFGTAKEELVALDSTTGKEVWAEPYKVPEGILPSLKLYQKNVIFSTQQGSLVSFDPITKRENWRQKFGRLNPQGAFCVFGDRIYVNSSTYLVGLRAFNGSVLWQENIGRTLDLAPAASVDGVVTISRDGNLYSYNLDGRPIFPKGVSLQAAPIAAPTFVGKMVCTVMTNGTVNLIDPLTGDAKWNFTMMSGADKNSSSQTGGSGAAGGGGAPGFGGGGQLGGQNNASAATTVNYTQAAGSAVAAGNSLAVITRDGSVFLFDKTLGVDLTPPDISQAWPEPGNDVSGKSPMEILFKIEDFGVGVNPETIKVTIDGTEYLGEFLREGYYSVKISPLTKNKPLDNGRRKVEVKAADWLGNMGDFTVYLKIDNSLPPVGSPKPKNQNNGGSGIGAPGGGDSGGPSGGGH